MEIGFPNLIGVAFFLSMTWESNLSKIIKKKYTFAWEQISANESDRSQAIMIM